MTNGTRTNCFQRRAALATRRSTHARAFTMMEVLVVATILGVFASIVIPRFAAAHESVATLMEHTFEADLRLARTEAIARARPVSLVVSSDRTSWWIADNASPDTPIAGAVRTCGQGSLYELRNITIVVKRDDGGANTTTPRGASIVATFDGLGTRDGATVDLAARDANGMIQASWTLLEGRSRLSHIRGN